MSVEYGSNEYYEETGKNGLTTNTKETESLPAYDKKLFYLDSFFKRMIYSDASRSLTTYSNFYYKDADGKIYYWHRKRKGRYACMPGGSIVYIDAEAAMERFTGRATMYSVIEPWKRAPVFHGIINGEAIFTVMGSTKFEDPDEDNLEVYLAKSKDGLLIEPVLNIHEHWNWSSRQYDRFKPNYMGKLGHFINESYEDGEEIKYNTKVYNYNGLNYTIKTIGEDVSYVSTDTGSYPICVVKRILAQNDRVYKKENDTDDCDFIGYSAGSWASYPTVSYMSIKLYNANFDSYIDVPKFTDLGKMMVYFSSPDRDALMDINSFPSELLRIISINPAIKIIGTCPNGNVLICIVYCQNHEPNDYDRADLGERFPEYYRSGPLSYFRRFYATPKYFVVDFNSGNISESNIKEPDDFDIGSNYFELRMSYNDAEMPKYLYTDSEYLWFRKPYREDTDITFYGTKDGYNIDKRITYYNRTSLPVIYHMMVKNYSGDDELFYNYDISKSNLEYSAVVPVPVFENGVFQKYMAVIASDYTVGYKSSGHNVYGLIDDLKPESDGRLHCYLTYCPADNQQYDRYRIRYTKKQPDQTDDDYIYDIE